jgi:hypothetical protein
MRHTRILRVHLVCNARVVAQKVEEVDRHQRRQHQRENGGGHNSYTTSMCTSLRALHAIGCRSDDAGHYQRLAGSAVPWHTSSAASTLVTLLLSPDTVFAPFKRRVLTLLNIKT